jgi:hypothetical protein
MTWDAYHRRAHLLREVIDEAGRRDDGALPMDLPGVRGTFGDELALVGALQLRWHTRLAGRIEHALMDRPADPEAAVVRGWRAAADDLPAVRRILDAHADRPRSAEMGDALTRARAKDRALMAAMAGRASLHDERAPEVGASLEQRARSAHRPTPTPRRRRGSAPGRRRWIQAVGT